MTNHIEARINKTQQSSRYRLCGDIQETIIHIISESCKLAQKEYKTRHNTVGKELCKNFKLTIRTNGVCIIQNLSWRMRRKSPL